MELIPLKDILFDYFGKGKGRIARMYPFDRKLTLLAKNRFATPEQAAMIGRLMKISKAYAARHAAFPNEPAPPEQFNPKPIYGWYLAECYFHSLANSMFMQIALPDVFQHIDVIAAVDEFMNHAATGLEVLRKITPDDIDEFLSPLDVKWPTDSIDRVILAILRMGDVTNGFWDEMRAGMSCFFGLAYSPTSTLRIKTYGLCDNPLMKIMNEDRVELEPWMIQEKIELEDGILEDLNELRCKLTAVNLS
jgi:hypothetical protein